MSEALPKARPVQGSEWMIAIRDYKFGLTVYEISVGSLYGTCGNWGQQVWLSDKAISYITGMTRRKASTARKTLLSLGLIEDTGQHGYQPNQREYRLTLPVEMPARRMEGDEPVEHTPRDTATALYGGDEPVEHTPCAPGAHPGEPVEHIRVSPQGTQELDLDLEVDLDTTTSGGVTTQTQDQDQNQDQGQEPGLDDIPSAESPSEQRGWIESLRSGAERPLAAPKDEPANEEHRAAYLAFMRDHTTPETGMRPSQVWDTLGMDHRTDIGFILQLHKEGVILPCKRGWYLADAA